MEDAFVPEEINRSVNALTGEVIDAAIDVHEELGPGLLERAYRACLVRALEERDLDAAQEVVIPVTFKGETLDIHHRVDLILEDIVPVELKACREIQPVHEAQLLTYLRTGGFPVGLLINFHVPKLVDGVTRIINPDR